MTISCRDLVRARAWVAAVAVIGASAITAAAPSPRQAGGNKTVYVAALDADNKPVPGLTKDTWAVREDGTDRTVVDAKPATDPLDIVLMIDTSRTSQASIGDLRVALQAFADALFAGSAPVTMSVMDVAAADVMVATGKKTAADVDKVLVKTFADRAGASVILEGLVDVSKQLAKSPSARRAIVIVNMDGVPEYSTTPGQKVIQAVVASGASVWAVTYQNTATKGLQGNTGGGGSGTTGSGDNAQGNVGTGNNGQVRDLLLQSVPGGTGGVRQLIQVPSALSEALGQVAAAIVGQYALTYARADGPMPKVVQVGETQPGVTIHYASTPIK
jgi:hypothetical protein